jgi:hypothetical protein
LAEGYFVQGTEPRSYCDRHVLREVEVKREDPSAEEMAPVVDIRRVGMLRYRRQLPRRIYVVDQSQMIAS